MKLHPSAASAFALSILASSASAQAYFEDEQEPEWSIRIDGRGYNEADFDSGGQLGLTRWGGTVARTWFGNEEDEFTRLSYRHEESKYDFGGGAVLFNTSPFEDEKDDVISGAYSSGRDEHRWLFDLSIVSGRADDVSLSGSIYGEGAIGILWEMSDRFELGLGIAGRTRLEEDDQFFPLPLFDWRATDNLRFSLLASADPELRGTYRFNENLDGYGLLRFDERQFRVKDQNTLQDAATVDTELGALAGIVWHGTAVAFEFFGGLGDRNLELDADGEKLVDDDIEVAPVVGASLTWTF